MWLAETAINQETLEDLWRHDLTYVILSPFQAQQVRSLTEDTGWVDVSRSG